MTGLIVALKKVAVIQVRIHGACIHAGGSRNSVRAEKLRSSPSNGASFGHESPRTLRERRSQNKRPAGHETGAAGDKSVVDLRAGRPERLDVPGGEPQRPHPLLLNSLCRWHSASAQADTICM